MSSFRIASLSSSVTLLLTCLEVGSRCQTTAAREHVYLAISRRIAIELTQPCEDSCRCCRCQVRWRVSGWKNPSLANTCGKPVSISHMQISNAIGRVGITLAAPTDLPPRGPDPQQPETCSARVWRAMRMNIWRDSRLKAACLTKSGSDTPASCMQAHYCSCIARWHNARICERVATLLRTGDSDSARPRPQQALA